MVTHAFYSETVHERARHLCRTGREVTRFSREPTAGSVLEGSFRQA